MAVLTCVLEGRRIAVAVALVLFAAGCGSFDEKGSDAPTSSTSSTSSGGAEARSVACSASACTGEDACCVSGSGEACAQSCGSDAPLFCDDGDDCPSPDKICCVNLVVAGDRSAGLKGSTCQSPASCEAPSNLQACRPTRDECGAKSCVLLTQVFPTVYPSHTLYVCQ